MYEWLVIPQLLFVANEAMFYFAVHMNTQNVQMKTFIPFNNLTLEVWCAVTIQWITGQTYLSVYCWLLFQQINR